MSDTQTTTPSILRDVNIRFEDGVYELWCVLPEDQHEQATEQLAALAHRLYWNDADRPLFEWFSDCDGPTIRVASRTVDADGGLDNDGVLEFDGCSEWLIRRDGRMLTLTRTSPEMD